MECLRVIRTIFRKPEYVKAIFCKSEALYNLCKFEYALLGYLKGSRLVPDSEAFKLGHIKCKKTINNSLTSDMFSVEDGRVVKFLDNFDMNSLYGGNVVKGKRESFFPPEAFILGAFVETWSNKYFQSDLYLSLFRLIVYRKDSILYEKGTFNGSIKGTRDKEGKYQ